MATYYADKVILNTFGVNGIEPKYIENGEIGCIATYTAPGGVTLAAGDTIQLMDLPAYVRVTAFKLDSQKLDSGGTPAITVNVGDALLATRYFAASTVGQNGGVGIASNFGVVGYTIPAVTRVFATIVAGAAGATTAGARFVFFMTYNADA